MSSNTNYVIIVAAGVVVGLLVYVLFLRKRKQITSVIVAGDTNTFIIQPPEKYTNYPVTLWDDSFAFDSSKPCTVSFKIASHPGSNAGLIVCFSSDIGRDQQMAADGFCIVFPGVAGESCRLTHNRYVETSLYVGIEKFKTDCALTSGDVVEIVKGQIVEVFVNGNRVLTSNPFQTKRPCEFIGFGVHTQPGADILPLIIKDVVVR